MSCLPFAFSDTIGVEAAGLGVAGSAIGFAVSLELVERVLTVSASEVHAVNILLTFLIGSALAWILIKITRTPPHLQGLIIGCCSAGNLGNLLLIIVPALCEESDSPFGESSVCSTYGEAYASLAMADSFQDKMIHSFKILATKLNLKKVFANCL
ncbi:hypothetical protein LWI28_015880 [Acer negundo]|uniref:PIN-like protein n=1 Tax=Acer negundo TaxID=4023 RepID=A0AAD5IFG1_ACENE|nr:hypothetical protein LWI28_015880 [Acer negundo]